MSSSPVPADGDRNGATTIATETATGSHELVVRRYSKSKGLLGVGRAMHSHAFDVGGHRWCIAYFPDGERDEYEEYIAVFLLVDPDVEGHVKVRCEFSLLDQDGEAVPAYRRWGINTFSSTDCGWVSHLIRREELESSPYLHDDSFRIRYDVTVVKEIQTDQVAIPTDLQLHRRLGDGGSATTIATETVTGSHLHVVDGYSKTKGVLGVGRCYYSGIFAVAGHNCCVLYYPDCCKHECSDYNSVFLKLTLLSWDT
ncbi:hypothetical protein BAE44_0010009 [Dichanthelium oligosanthes]|uniref:MATH domain-containing protein n=1 Tax=Dichanthelium oligosanthes TaxID=888268 RepID=A0A1E5VV13_9POAL|nr:hypothetical protein BAE44_0010009 [Dichanthelium oligosanthes]